MFNFSSASALSLITSLLNQDGYSLDWRWLLTYQQKLDLDENEIIDEYHSYQQIKFNFNLLVRATITVAINQYVTNKILKQQMFESIYLNALDSGVMLNIQDFIQEKQLKLNKKEMLKAVEIQWLSNLNK